MLPVAEEKLAELEQRRHKEEEAAEQRRLSATAEEKLAELVRRRNLMV